MNLHLPHDYTSQREALIAYLLAKVAAGDWHGVRDAAVDIEILEAEEAVRQKST